MKKAFRFLAGALFAVATVIAAAPRANATLMLRITEYASNGTTVIASSGILTTGASGQSFFGSIGTDFSLVIASNIATTGGALTAQSETVNLTYNGTVIGLSSPMLVVEFLGTPYNAPPAGSPATIISNASPSTAGLAANVVDYVSGVTTTGALPALSPGTSGGSPYLFAPASLGTTVQSGSMGGASSILLPNPSGGSLFTVPANFDFYQRLTFAQFTNTGQTGSISAGSVVTAIPEPSSVVMAAMALPFVAVIFRRRVRAARA